MNLPPCLAPIRRVGLTGGIASGKSTVSSLLATRFGLPVLDLDQVARQVVEPGTPALARIARVFGDQVLAPDGRLDRKVLGRLVVQDPEARLRLESITHPAIFEHTAAWMEQQHHKGHPCAAVEAALLVETGFYRWFHVVVVVVASAETQVRRVMARNGMTAEEARAWVNAQASTAQRESIADVLLPNDGSAQELEACLVRVWPSIVGQEPATETQ